MSRSAVFQGELFYFLSYRSCSGSRQAGSAEIPRGVPQKVKLLAFFIYFII